MQTDTYKKKKKKKKKDSTISYKQDNLQGKEKGQNAV